MEKFDIGYPCHKYLLRTVASDDEFQTFAVNYVHTLLNAGLSYEDVKISFIMFCSNYGSMENQHHYRVELNRLYNDQLDAEAYVNSILSSKPVSADCARYYKVTIEQRANICKICPLSIKTYQNRHFDDEMSILKYFLNHPDDLKVFLQQCELSKFTSIIDCNSEFLEERPLLFPVFKTIITALKKECNTVASALLIGKTLESLLEYFIPEINTALSRIKNVSYKNIPKLDLIHKYIWSIILNAADITLDDVYDIYATISNGKKPEDNHKKISEVKSDLYSSDAICITLEDILSSYDAATDTATQEEPILETESTAGTVESELNCETNEGEATSISEETFASPIQEDSFSAESPSEYGENSSSPMSEDVPFQDDEESTGTNESDNSVQYGEDEQDYTNTQIPFRKEKTVLEGTFRVVPPPEPNEPDEDTGTEWSGIKLDTKNIVSQKELQKEQDALEDIIPAFRVDRFQLYKCAKDLANNKLLLHSFEATAISEQRIYVEAVLDDSGTPFVLIWNRKEHCYLYSYLQDDDSTQILLPLFSAQRITTYCYSPYLLYALIRQKEGALRNVFSILTNHRYITKYTNMEKPPLRYKDVLEFYTHRISFGTSMFNVSGNEQDITNWVLLGMPMYQYVIKEQQAREKVLIRLRDYSHMRYMDEALGYSYLVSSVFPECDTNFYLPELHSFHFKDIVSVDKCTCNGYLIKYEIIDNLPEDNTVLENVICTLVEKGRFRQYQISLYTFCTHFVIFFIGAEDFTFLTTLLHIAITDELEEQNFSHAGFNSFYKYIEKNV